MRWNDKSASDHCKLMANDWMLNARQLAILSLLSHENAPSIISFIVPSGMPHHHRLL
jgi:hypothetical protein